MKRKLILIPCLALLLSLASVGSIQAQRSQPTTTQSSSVTYSEKITVCYKLATDRVLDLRTALMYLRSGNMTITKVCTGHYWAMFNGGPAITVLVDENF